MALGKTENSLRMLFEDPWRRGSPADVAAKILWKSYAEKYHYYSDEANRITIEPTVESLAHVSYPFSPTPVIAVVRH